MSMVGNEIGWSTTPSDMVVRIRDAMVHHVFRLVGSIQSVQVVLECGVVTLRSEATETQDPVDCMACMIRRTTTVIDAELAAYEEAYP